MLIDRLIKRIDELRNPTVVGLDPAIDFVPEALVKAEAAQSGETLKAIADAFYRFNTLIIDSVCDIVPAVKPQIAMYEQLGFEGVRCYENTVKYAKEKGLTVIGDIKRGDISSTALCYSNAHIGRTKAFGKELSVFDADFVTLNPYLGDDSITPFLDDCKKYDKGLFILVKNSNKGSGRFQNLILEGRELYKHVGKFVEEMGNTLIGESGYSNIGAVVGATYPEELKELRAYLPNTFFLIPGYGAQGGKAADVALGFDKNGHGAIVNSSRGIIGAYAKKAANEAFSEDKFKEITREAAIAMRSDLMNCMVK